MGCDLNPQPYDRESNCGLTTRQDWRTVKICLPVVVVDVVDVDGAEGEWDVDDDEDEEKDHDVEDHVGHADDDRTRLAPHQTDLSFVIYFKIKLYLKRLQSNLS